MTEDKPKVYGNINTKTLYISVPGLRVTLWLDGHAVIEAPNVRMHWTKEQVDTVARLFSSLVTEEDCTI